MMNCNMKFEFCEDPSNCGNIAAYLKQMYL